LLIALVLCSACLPDPRRAQMVRLFDQLVEAHVALSGQPPETEPACADVSEVGSRLSGEPGLTEVRDVWPALRMASDALLAACGQATLLAQPFDPTPAMLQARERWQMGLEHELLGACDQLERAAPALQRNVKC
jgi:hypothetical protein